MRVGTGSSMIQVYILMAILSHHLTQCWLMLISPTRTTLNENGNKIQSFSAMKIHLKKVPVSSGRCGLNGLHYWSKTLPVDMSPLLGGGEVVPRRNLYRIPGVRQIGHPHQNRDLRGCRQDDDRMMDQDGTVCPPHTRSTQGGHMVHRSQYLVGWSWICRWRAERAEGTYFHHYKNPKSWHRN